MKLNKAKIVIGDNRQTLRSLESGSVQTCITSPPYWGLRDYGEQAQIGMEQTPAEFVEELCKVFDEVWRVLADDGTLWLNLGDTYLTIPHGAKGVNAPQSFDHKGSQGRGQDRSGVVSAGGGHANRKPIEGFKHKDLIGIPWRVAFALQERGWYLRQDIIWAKPNPMPESVTDRCTKSHEYLFLLTKNSKYFFDNTAIKEPTDNGEKRNKRDVWTVNTSRFKGAHFATYPPELIEPCVLAGSREGDLVLDPFSGSGTTGVVALANGRNYVGCELNQDYAQLSVHRIQDNVGMLADVDLVFISE